MAEYFQLKVMYSLYDRTSVIVPAFKYNLVTCINKCLSLQKRSAL